MFQSKFLAILAILPLLGVPLPSVAADLPTPAINVDSLRPTLERYAELYLLRASFDVISVDEVPALLSSDAHALAAGTAPKNALSELNEELTAEGSYYITSLYYLISVDGAAWPTDHAESYYKADALPKLEDIRHQWLAAVNDNGDLKSLLLALDQINAQTHGEVDLTSDLDHFSAVDQLVDDTLAKLKAQV